MSPHEQPWALSPEQALAAFEVQRETGLSVAEVRARRERFGYNQLRQAEAQHTTAILVRQFRGLIVGLLAVGAALSFALGETVEGFAIVAVIAINACIGFVTELRAVRSMEALRELGTVQATVRRDGRLEKLPAGELLPGDIVVVEGGDVVTADARLVAGSRLAADESTLTGESVPVDKDLDALPPPTALADRHNMLWKGTSVTRGSGEAVVVATGMRTELGRISELLEATADVVTPLERRLDRLARGLVWAALGFVLLIAVLGVLGGRDLVLVLETAIALAVATVPEGLPIVATLALARGMWRMVRRNALVEQLAAVETLGATSVILTDKTGTLTENRMAVDRIALADRELARARDGGGFEHEGRAVALADEPLLRELLTAAALCTAAELREDEGAVTGVGDPMEVALLLAAHRVGLSPAELRARMPEARQEAFDPDLKMMATYHAASPANGLRVAVKGAAEAVLEVCTREIRDDGEAALAPERRALWQDRAERMGARGLRVLAVASKEVADVDAPAYGELTLLGLVGLLDPPRIAVREAIDACQRAGVRVVMVTGDHAGTALNIACAVGIAREGDAAVTGEALRELDALSDEEKAQVLAAPVVARATPQQKLRLLSLYQEAEETVAMIGDGVNDAPALKQADIGVAMGQRGTAVAREAAAMVLRDDDFRTIVVAVEQGRVIFDNIRKFVVYLLGCNLSEILVVGLASAAGGPLPILPLQILFLNLVTDVFPALALGVGEGDPRIMRRRPRPRGEPIMRAADWRRVVLDGGLLSAAVLVAFAAARGPLALDATGAVTLSFVALALSQVWHVFDMAEPDSDWLRNEVTRNAWVWGAVVLCVLLVLGGVYIAPLARVLSLRPLDAAGWGVALGLSLVPLMLGRGAAVLRGGTRGAALARA